LEYRREIRAAIRVPCIARRRRAHPEATLDAAPDILYIIAATQEREYDNYERR
jgi:hypothetical protein